MPLGDGKDEGHRQRSEHGTELVQSLVESEAPAIAHLLGGVGQHRVPGGVPYRLPTRSRTISRAATGQLPASASIGTTAIWST